MRKKTVVSLTLAGVLALLMLFTTSFLSTVNAKKEQSPADLNDLEMAHVAHTADLIDIRYANLALEKSKNPVVIKFAETMIRDHSAVNDQALALLKKLNANAQDNFLSKQLSAQADQLVDEMSSLSGKAFDQRYADNELAYHQSVNCLVGGTFIPNIENPELKALFEQALKIFKAHEQHAEKMVASLKGCE